jgi:hypothetical protein
MTIAYIWFKQFSNSKINGRNAIIFALVQSKVMGETGELDEKKLMRFVEKYSEMGK